MLYTEEAVKANIRNREGKRVFFLGKGDSLTPGARDWLNGQRIEIRSGDEAKITEYRLLNGGYLREKPEYMTHLQGDILVLKTHPRIVFRGALDTLEAELLLCQCKAPGVKKELGEILDFVRRIVAWEVLDEPVSQDTLCGLDQDQIRQRSHFPQEYYHQPHFMPAHTDGEEILHLNRCRCAARSAELSAVQAFLQPDGTAQRVDILQAMNRISSMLYLLMIRLKAERME